MFLVLSGAGVVHVRKATQSEELMGSKQIGHSGRLELVEIVWSNNLARMIGDRKLMRFSITRLYLKGIGVRSRSSACW